MNEFIEKLIGRLEEEIEWAKSHGTEEMFRKGRISGLNTAKRISNQIAEEYNKQNIDQDLMIVESLPSLYPMMQPFEVEAIDRVIERAKYSGGLD